MMKRTQHFNLPLPMIYIIMIAAMAACCLACSADSSAATPKTKLKVRSKTLYMNGTYTIPLKSKIKKATYFYSSNRTKVAKVNAKGKITARGKGTAKIKVRYKHKRKLYSVGNFTVSVRKTSMRSDVGTIRTTVGATISPSDYLNDQNAAADYTVSSSNNDVTSIAADGTITVKKAGNATLSVTEEYKGKTRSLGTFSLYSVGASLRTDTIKMAYNSTYDMETLLVNKVADASYSFSSSNNLLVQVAGSQISASSNPGYDSECSINAYESINGNVRLIGSVRVLLIQTAYIAEKDRALTVGVGTVLDISEQCIKLMNRDPNAVYTIQSDNPDIVDENLTALKYGTAILHITETKPSGIVTTLNETVTVTVTAAVMKPELVANGLEMVIDGDNYGDYPVNYPNRMANYYYTSSDTKICQTGIGDEQDYLMLYPKNPGTVTITVYEVSQEHSSQRTVGSFEVRITKDNGDISGVDEMMAADLISSCTLYHKGKSFKAAVSSDSLECAFADEEGNGLLDYGMDYSTLTPGNFTIIPVRDRFLVDRIEASEDDPSVWTAYIDLQNGSEKQETDIIPIQITLAEAPLDPAGIFASIQIKLGSARGIIDKKSVFPDDEETLQFADENTSYYYNFTARQYIAAGANEYDENYDGDEPVSLSDLTNVFCTPMQSVWSKSNPTANTAVRSISEAETSDNSSWNFTVTFDNEATVDFDVTLGLAE